MPCRVVTAGTGAAAMPAFVCDSLAAVPTMGNVTSSFWGAMGERGWARMAPISVVVVRDAVMVGPPMSPGFVPSSSMVLVSFLLARATHAVTAAGTTPSPVSS